MVFTVSLSAPSLQDIEIHYAMPADTASAGVDYLELEDTLIIPAGQTTAQITVAVVGDLDTENDETFHVVLGNASGAVLLDDSGTGLVAKDDTDSLPPFEQFTGPSDPVDLAYSSLEFIPGDAGTPYDIVTQSIGQLPTDPAGGTVLQLGDDDGQRVDLTDGQEVSLFGQAFSAFYVGSNGTITFTEPDRDNRESVADHLDTLRISALSDDFDPRTGGRIVVQQRLDRVVVTWENISQHSQSGSNTFQAEMFFDGRIRLAWLSVTTLDWDRGAVRWTRIAARNGRGISVCAVKNSPHKRKHELMTVS